MVEEHGKKEGYAFRVSNRYSKRLLAVNGGGRPIDHRTKSRKRR